MQSQITDLPMENGSFKRTRDFNSILAGTGDLSRVIGRKVGLTGVGILFPVAAACIGANFTVPGPTLFRTSLRSSTLATLTPQLLRLADKLLPRSSELGMLFTPGHIALNVRA